MAMLGQPRNIFAGAPLRGQQASWYNPLVLMNFVQSYHSHQPLDISPTLPRTGPVTGGPLDSKQPSLAAAAADAGDFGGGGHVVRSAAPGPRATVAEMAVDAVIQQHKASASSLPTTNVASAGNVVRSGGVGGGNIPRKPQMTRPKRPLSAYNLFFRRERANLLGEDISHEEAEYPAGPEKKRRRRHRKTHGKMGFQDMARYVAKRWKALDPGAKAEFEDRAAKNLQRYWKEMDVYKKEWEIYEERQKIQDMISDDRGVSIDDEFCPGSRQGQDSIVYVPTVDSHMKFPPKSTPSSSKRKVENKETNQCSSHSPTTDASSPTTGGRVGTSGLDLLTAVMEERC